MFWIKMILSGQDVRSEAIRLYQIGKFGQIFLSRKFWAAFWLLVGYLLKQYKGIDVDTEQWLANTMQVVGWIAQIFGVGLAGATISDTVTIKKPEEPNGVEPINESGRTVGIDKSL